MRELNIFFINRKIINLLEYRQKKMKYKDIFPYYNIYIYYGKKYITYLLLFIGIAICTFMIYENKLKVSNIFFIINLCILLVAYLSRAHINLFNEKYKLINYANSGYFGIKERKVLNKNLILLIIINNIAPYILILVYFGIVNFVFINENIKNYVYISGIIIWCLIYRIYKDYYNEIKENILKITIGNKKITINLFLGIIGIIIINKSHISININQYNEITVLIDNIIKFRYWNIAFLVILTSSLLVELLSKKVKKMKIDSGGASI